MQMLRLAGYGGRVVPVNPKGGTIFGYEAVTSIAAIDPPVDLAVIVIRPDAIVEVQTREGVKGWMRGSWSTTTFMERTGR